jgi:hypothetical protein
MIKRLLPPQLLPALEASLVAFFFVQAMQLRFRLPQPQQMVTPLPLTVLQPNVPIEIEVVGR